MKLLQVVRFDEWRASKLIPLFVGAVLAAHARWDGLMTSWLVIAFTVVVLFNASFGYAINNLSDARVDAEAGKPNAFSQMATWKATVVVTVLMLGGMATATLAFWSAPGAIAWTALSFGAAAAYSVKPIRLKERGALGLAASSLAQRVIPLFIIFSALNAWTVTTAVFAVLAFLIGVRFILIHQMHDLERDRSTGVATFLTARNIDFADKAILRVVFPLELVFLSLLTAALTSAWWPQGIALLLGVIAYFGVQLRRLGGGSYRSIALSYLGLNSIYSVVLPIVVVAPFVARAPASIPILLVAIVMVWPEVFRVGANAATRWRLARADRLASKRQNEKYPFPIGILLFNRPEYARQFLESLLQQDLAVDPSRVVIHIDAFEGSRDAARGAEDQTDETLAIVEEFLPGATVITPERNTGIARAFDVVETHVSAMDDSPWLTFFEEDFVLYPNYLRAMVTAIRAVDSHPDAAIVSATGDSRAAAATGAPAVSRALVAQLHLWAFSIRRSHLDERRSIVEAYLESISSVAYWERQEAVVWQACTSVGIFPMGTSQDYIKRAALVKFGRVALTTVQPYGFYVGQYGEHFTPLAFESQGYHIRSPQPTELPDVDGDIEAQIQQAKRDFDVMMAQDGVENIIVPLTATRQVTHATTRWKVKDDQLFLEGPFPELGLFRPFVWLTGNSSEILLEVNAPGRYRVHAVVANSLANQTATITIGDRSHSMDIPDAGPLYPSILTLECDLVAGENLIRVSYSRHAVAPGDTRELGIMLYDVYV